MATCSLGLGLWLLLLLQDIQAAPQTSFNPSHSCDTLGNWFYDESSRSCCYRCPSGYVKKKSCPKNPDEDCLRCGPEQYVNEESQRPRCDACVSCAKESDLVEKKPCSFNSSRVCECRPGLFCQTSVVNTCSRCQQHTVCQPGFGVKIRGTSTTDVTCEKCPAGTFSDQHSSTDICKPHTNCAELNKVALHEGNATHDQVCLDELPTHFTPSTPSDETSNSDLRRLKENPVTGVSILLRVTTTENPSSTPESKALPETSPTSAKEERTTGGNKGVILWGVVLSVMVLLVGMLLFWKRKVCKKRILILKGKPHLQSVISHKPRLKSQEGQSCWLPCAGRGRSGCHKPLDGTFFPLHPKDWAMCQCSQALLEQRPINFWALKCERRVPKKSSDQVNKCAKIILTTDSGLEEKELIDRTLPLENNNNLLSSTEKSYNPELSLTDVTQSNGNAPDCPTDSRVRDHTNNRIEKIYITNADTVIVGYIPEVLSGKNCAVRGCENSVDAQENTEEELAVHYPEQETESFPGNDVMVPVEEEGKEFHHPTTATEK